MNEQDLITRTKQFALRVMKVVGALPKTTEGRAIADQLMRSGTLVSANYPAACKGRSRAQFLSKLGTVEARELVATFAASRKTTSRNTKWQTANRKLQMPRRKPTRRSKQQ